MNIVFKQINASNLDLIENLATEAHFEGFEFVKRTIFEWKSGLNDFSKQGEILFGICISDLCIGLGGLNVDPYINNPNIGRVRHVYISPKYRRKGLGILLLNKIIHNSANHFELLRLYTNNLIASTFYESLGFKQSFSLKVTHILKNLDKYPKLH
ncbi:MAG: GNAT family N-acetyltransferase [Candidatus Hermodarchaeota archaeon]